MRKYILAQGRMYILSLVDKNMTLSKEDFAMISTLLACEFKKYDMQIKNLEKIVKQYVKGKKGVDDSWMSYQELAENIVALSGEEINRDFNIVRMNE